ncbi:cation:proton antiporter [Bacillus sp. ISL-75]|nr:cation:proton antiporter [Bacillus sp. ISL-75]
MEQQGSIISLLIVSIVAFLTPILLHRFKLQFVPVVVAEIIMGLIIGKSGFNLVHEDTWLGILSTLGFLFLMFLSGLEIDFRGFSMKQGKKLRKEKVKPNTFLISSIIFAGIFIVSFGLSFLFVLAGFIHNVFLMTLIISSISLGVVVPTLKEANLMKTNIGQIILLIAVIADLVTMISLAVFESLFGKDGGHTWTLLILFAVGAGLYFIANWLKKRKIFSVLAAGTTQIGTRAVFTLLIAFVAISQIVGAENILGAFLAGVIVSLLSPNKEMVLKLDSFGYGFFIPIFFVMIGVKLDLWSLLSEKKMLMLIPLLLIALLLSKLIPAIFLRKWYDIKTVISSGFLLTSTLSVVIAAATVGQRIGVITQQMSGTLILVAVISCVVTPILFKKMFSQRDDGSKEQNAAFTKSNNICLPLKRKLNSTQSKPNVVAHRAVKSRKRIV